VLDTATGLQGAQLQQQANAASAAPAPPCNPSSSFFFSSGPPLYCIKYGLLTLTLLRLVCFHLLIYTACVLTDGFASFASYHVLRTEAFTESLPRGGPP
jgi:hypothetical protein